MMFWWHLGRFSCASSSASWPEGECRGHHDYYPLSVRSYMIFGKSLSYSWTTLYFDQGVSGEIVRESLAQVQPTILPKMTCDQCYFPARTNLFRPKGPTVRNPPYWNEYLHDLVYNFKLGTEQLYLLPYNNTVPPSTKQHCLKVPSNTAPYRPIANQVPNSNALYWRSTSKYQFFSSLKSPEPLKNFMWHTEYTWPNFYSSFSNAHLEFTPDFN